MLHAEVLLCLSKGASLSFNLHVFKIGEIVLHDIVLLEALNLWEILLRKFYRISRLSEGALLVGQSLRQHHLMLDVDRCIPLFLPFLSSFLYYGLIILETAIFNVRELHLGELADKVEDN